MPDAPTSPDPEAMARRIADLEAELARVKTERDFPKDAAYSAMDHLVPYIPMTAEEVHDMMHGPRGQPITEIIAELEAELSGGPRVS